MSSGFSAAGSVAVAQGQFSLQLLDNSTSEDLQLTYTYNAAPWTITPYFQFTNVPANAALGFGQDASTWGGAILANYSINDNWNLAGRGEYIGSSGSPASRRPGSRTRSSERPNSPTSAASTTPPSVCASSCMP